MRRTLPFTLILCLLSIHVLAFDRYGDGCDGCHGGFLTKPYVSLKDGTAWPESLHNLHRGSTFMDADCGACHQVDGDKPHMSKSRAGYGCAGCHGILVGEEAHGPGLRQHHRVAGASTCSPCHANPETPPPEGSVKPPYYGTTVAKVDDPCNALPATLEDWSGDGIGLDNDGDNLYDSSDPDCGSSNRPPTASFTHAQTPCTTSMQFTDTSSDPDAGDSVVSWEWDFQNDGVADSTERNPLFDFGAAGDFTVKLTVLDESSTPGSTTASVKVVLNQPPVAAFTSSVTASTAQFTDQSSDADGSVMSWLWSFGDGATSAEPSPSHAYAGDGTYDVTLEVTDDCGAVTKSAVKSVTIGGILFHRGDPNDDGTMNITDGIYVLNFLFIGGPDPTCSESGDANDDGTVNITDGIYILNFLFIGGPAPPEPGSPESGPCGPDRPGSPANLGCASYTSCG